MNRLMQQTDHTENLFSKKKNNVNIQIYLDNFLLLYLMKIIELYIISFLVYLV
ncbi:hypothetical protein BN1088_1430714 [Sphingobacterium sp. PM2-P1-29]|nr:hypothetical protein BN1088_1430714 [Sphingobacterium sp. PM2-P1-29]